MTRGDERGKRERSGMSRWARRGDEADGRGGVCSCQEDGFGGVRDDEEVRVGERGQGGGKRGVRGRLSGVENCRGREGVVG